MQKQTNRRIKTQTECACSEAEDIWEGKAKEHPGCHPRKRPIEETEMDKSFEKILMDAVDEALLSLGENVGTSIYFHVDDLFKIKKQEIPFRINDFSFALKQIFGLGAHSLETMFMKKLCSKIRADPQRLMGELIVPEITFEEYVCLMKRFTKTR